MSEEEKDEMRERNKLYKAAKRAEMSPGEKEEATIGYRGK